VLVFNGCVIDTDIIRKRYDLLAPHLDERGLRLFAASEAMTAGHGGIVARSTIGRGLKDLAANEEALPHKRVRRTGGGRKAAVAKQPGLIEDLRELIQSALRGDPEAALLWVSKSQEHLAAALVEKGYDVSRKIVGRLLRDMGFISHRWLRVSYVGLVQNWGCQRMPDIFAPVLGPGVGRGVDFEVGGSRGRGSLRGHHGDQQA
jgi:Rhodopirellula transposase DDE domain